MNTTNWPTPKTAPGYTLVIPDVHERIEKLEHILRLYGTDAKQVVYLGDFFDSWDGVTAATQQTADFLKARAQYWNLFNLVLLGNHDLQYMYPKLKELRCTGYDANRQWLIDQTLQPRDWKTLDTRLTHRVGKWLLSHAGFSAGTYADLRDAGEAYTLASLNTFHRSTPLVRAGRARGGTEITGGCTWLDWNREFEPLANVWQLVGHSEGESVRRRDNEEINSYNICLDTGLNHIALIGVDSEVEILEVR